MSVFRLKTVNAEITYTYSNSKALRPRTSGEHGTHGALVFQNLMYRLMYIFRPPSEGSALAPPLRRFLHAWLPRFRGHFVSG
jgi:hypothetical protein